MFNVKNILSAESTDIKELKPGAKSLEELLSRTVAVVEPGTENLKTWDGAKYGKIVDRFTSNYINYVIVMFDHPGNPPSNQTRYLYLAK